MFDPQQLKEFLVKAKKSTYASGDETTKIIENDTSTTLTFKEGDFKYHDNYFGGEPFGGREVVFFQGNPIYLMTYYGFVAETVADVEAVYTVLRSALSAIPADAPYRGPQEFVSEGYTYTNLYSGEVENFFGLETIVDEAGVEVYRARYSGGRLCK